jgi:serine/threonine protein kinase/WD40 repeat protein
VNDESKFAQPKDPRGEAALREYLEQDDRGEPLDREEFLARHALIADQLRSFIAAEDQLRSFIDAKDPVRNLAATATPLDRAQDSTKSFVAHAHETIVPRLPGKRATEAMGAGLSGRFGRYTIIRALGKGAMGTVYLAEDTQIERLVALKTPHFNEDPTGEQMERFIREARAAGNLRHPHICPIYDFGQIDGRHFITMAYIEGRPLSEFIQPDNQQAERQVLLLVRKLAMALQEAHDHGVVHRDLKPANIMVDKKGDPIIMDFGLAQQTRRNEDVRLTQTGNILGTPAFMSPEQVEGEPEKIGPPTDQYSLGVILYELLTGELPFRGSVMAVMGQILTKEPSPPSELRHNLDPRIEAVCLKMMAKNPSERFASMKGAADEIAAILKSPSAKSIATAKSTSFSAPSTGPTGAQSSSDRMPAAGPSQASKSLKRRALTESKLEPLDELARLATEPGPNWSRNVQDKYFGSAKRGAARIGPLRHFRQAWNQGGWISWSVLALGLVAFGVATAVVVINWGKTAVVIDIKDPGVEVAVRGTTLTITGPDTQSVKVAAGDQELTITCAGLETITKSFSLKAGDKKTITVSIVDSQIVARLEGEILPLTADHQQRTSSTPAGSASKPLLLQNSLPQRTEPPIVEQEQSAIRILHGHAAPVKHLLFTPDGSRIVSASNSNHNELRGGTNFNDPGTDNTVRVWHVGSGKQIRKFSVKEGIGYGPQGIALSPDGRLVAACTSWDWGRSYTQPRVFVWDIASATRRYHFALRGDRAMRAVGFSPDGATLYALRDGRGVHSWSMLDGQESGTIELKKQHPAATPFATTFTSGCRHVLGGLWSGGVRLWDRETGMEERTFEGHTKVPSAVALSPDGTRILSSAGDFSVRMWETESGRQVFCMDNLDSIVSCVAFSPDGRCFMTGAEDGMVRVFEVATQKERGRFSGHTAKVNCVAYSPDGRLAASSSNDTTIHLWQLP